MRPTRQLRAYAAIQSESDSTRREQRKAQMSRTRARAGRRPSRAARPPGTDPRRHRIPTQSAARPGPGTIARDRRRRRPTPCRGVAPVHRPPASTSPQEPHPGQPMRSTERRRETPTHRKPEPGGTATTIGSSGQWTKFVPSALTRPHAERPPQGGIAPLRGDQPNAQIRDPNHQSDGKARTEVDGDPDARGAACRSADGTNG